MTLKQEVHLGNMKRSFSTLVDLKYRQGQEEHGGNLWSKTPLELLKEARAEIIDMFVYTQTAIEKLEKHG